MNSTTVTLERQVSTRFPLPPALLIGSLGYSALDMRLTQLEQILLRF